MRKFVVSSEAHIRQLKSRLKFWLSLPLVSRKKNLLRFRALHQSLTTVEAYQPLAPKYTLV